MLFLLNCMVEEFMNEEFVDEKNLIRFLIEFYKILIKIKDSEK